MAYSILIAGTDRTGDIISSSVVVEDNINDKINNCSFQLMDLSGIGVPVTDDEVIITLADDTILFGGFITNTSMSKKGTGEMVVNIQCVDYTSLFDRNLVHKTYQGDTDAEIIGDIVSTYCAGSGITTASVIEGVTINSIKFNYLQPSQVMRQITQLTGRNWYIDYEKDLHYFPLTTNVAPFNISDETTIVQEPMGQTAILTGTLLGDATFENADTPPENSYVNLTPEDTSQDGQLEYEKTLPSTFTAEAVISNSARPSGGDAIYIYWGHSVTPQAEDWYGSGGYVVAFDEFSNQIQLLYNGTILTYIAYTDPAYDEKRTVTVEISGNNLKVYVNKTLYINHNDTTRTLGGNLCGIGARTGAAYNWHHCYSFFITAPATDYSDLRISKDNTQLKNRIYVRGGTKLSDPTTYSVKGDGAAKQFPLPDKPHDVSITVNGDSKTLGVKNIDTSGYDWYLNYQEKYIEQDTGGSTLATTDTLAVTYTYDIPILVAVEDTISIGTNGVKEFAIFDKSIDTTQAARDRASAELTDYANDIIEGSFITHTTGFRSGQYIHIDLTDYGIDDDYIIQKITARSFGGGNFYYQISLANSKTLGIIKFLIEMLEADKNMIVLDDSEVIDELYTLTDLLISDSLVDDLTIDSTGPYFTWCTASGDSSPITRARWELFQWGV